MRIISGQFKGKSIKFIKSSITRPLKDSVKENIFNIINHSNLLNINLKKSTILDLYSGIGSFGIECISRGVKHVTFVENYENILSILKKNLSDLKSVTNYSIIEKDIIHNFDSNDLKKKFDIIFLDPPYKIIELKEIISPIISQKILKQNGIMIIHRHKNQNDILPKPVRILEEKKYGISKILFCTYN